MGWGLWKEHYELPTHGDDWIVEGQIASLPEYQHGRVRFEFIVHNMTSLSVPQQNPTVNKLRVSWYKMPLGTELLPGQRWRFVMRVFTPHSFINPGGFDYERWMFEKGIQGAGYVRGEASLLAPATGYFFTRLRMSIRNQIESLDTSTESKAIISALMIGDRSHLSDDVWQVFFRNGISHLIAISGLHITLVGGLMFLLALSFFYFFSRISSTRVAAFFSLGAIWFYAFCVGFSLPTQRATVMISVIFITTIFLRQPQLLFSYVLALASVLFMHPLAGFNNGFYFSFVAAAIILLAGRYLFVNRYFTTPYMRMRHYLIRFVLLQILLVISLTPFSALFFHAFSLLGLVVNLIAIPITTFILMPWILATWVFIFLIPPLGQISLNLLAYVMHILYQPLERLAMSDWALIQLTQPTIFLIICAVLGLIFVIVQPRPSFYILGGICFLPLFFAPSTAPAPGSAHITFLDVGQGLAIHIRTATRNLLYDVGPRYSRNFDASDIIIPYLHSYGITRLDRIIVSHRDTDHAGGLDGLLKDMEIESLMLNFPSSLTQEYEKTKCITGMRWVWDGVQFEIIHPDATYPISDKRRNNNSCVLLMSIGDERLLLSGDIEEDIEEQLLDRFDNLKASILQVPHHGSSSSSGLNWVKFVQPDYAVFSAGYNNPFSHPRPEIFDRYEDSERLITWQTGSAHFEMNAHTTVYRGGWRYKIKRYWHRDFDIY